jgi:hypothetical protein
MKQKQKGKAAIEDQDELGFEDQDGGDLFGDLAVETTTPAKAAPQTQFSPQEVEKTDTQPRATTYSPEKKVKFDELFSRLEDRAGKSLGGTITNGE